MTLDKYDAEAEMLAGYNEFFTAEGPGTRFLYPVLGLAGEADEGSICGDGDDR